MKSHALKPFPATFFDIVSFKRVHYEVWWTLCNEFDEDENGYMFMTRQEFFKAIDRCGFDVGNSVNVITTLEKWGFLQVERIYKGEHHLTPSHLKIKINPDTWTTYRPSGKLAYNSSMERTNYFRQKYAAKKAQDRLKYEAKKEQDRLKFAQELAQQNL